MKATLGQRLRYWFDNLMSRGTPALIGMLFVASLIVVALAATVISLAGFVQDGEAGRLSFGEAAWQSLMRTLDSGTMGGDTGSGFRGVMLLVTLGGVFIVSALIGVLNNGIETKMDALRKGRSRVLESNHTLILGWSAQIFTILNELILANANQRRASIVILADKDKVEMEDEIRERVQLRRNTQIICRSGRPIDPSDVEIANPQGAKSIIVLPPEMDDPDAEVIKAVLAITNAAGRRPEPYSINTQVRDAKNLSVLRMVCAQDHLQVVQTGDLISRLVAQASHQSGLSVVYTELLDFGGDEIYFKEEAGLTGKTYGEALLAYEDSSVMGIRKTAGAILLNPPMDTRLEAGDQLFALSEDDDTIRLSGLAQPPVEASLVRGDAKPRAAKPAKCLILGWNQNGATIVRELDHYVAPGSQVTIVADLDDGAVGAIRKQAGKLQHQKLDVQQGDTTDRELLDGLHIDDYDHVIVLAYTQRGVQEADAATLVTLLHLRDISGRDHTPFSIVSEMLDLRNRELAQAAKVDDFIVSEQLVSLMMAQFSENADLYAVFADIFDPDGSEIYLKPAADYVETGRPVNFYTVVEAARRRGETAIGYRILAEASEARLAFGVHTNPKKSASVIFGEGDKVIVLAEE
jgi:Trk K+ transport system NAD-binding subunit